MAIHEYLYILAVLFWVRGTDEKTANTMVWVAAGFGFLAQVLGKLAP